MAKRKSTAASQEQTATPITAELRLRYAECRVVAFSIVDAPELNQPSKPKVQFHISHEATFDEEENVVTVVNQLSLYSGEGTAQTTYMETTVQHRFHIVGLEKLPSKDRKNEFPATFMRSMLGLAFSATRGIIADRLRGTALSDKIVPIVSASRLYSVNEEFDKGGEYPV